MKKLIELPDKNLRYLSHKTDNTSVVIHVKSISKRAKCPHCGSISKKVHSLYNRTIHDLPIQGKKTKIVLNNKKYFCVNEDCKYKTFAESFSFFEPSATKTNRLQEEILRVSLTQSSISAAKYLQNSVADVGKSTICNMIKKTRENNQ